MWWWWLATPCYSTYISQTFVLCPLVLSLPVELEKVVLTVTTKLLQILTKNCNILGSELVYSLLHPEYGHDGGVDFAEV